MPGYPAPSLLVLWLPVPAEMLLPLGTLTPGTAPWSECMCRGTLMESVAPAAAARCVA